MSNQWIRTAAQERIDDSIAELPLHEITIKPYVRDTNLHDLPRHLAYRVDGVHLYADILNMRDLLQVTQVEGEMCHRRTLRFLNLHYRAVHRILERIDAIRVDFHNQRLHTVLAKPYDGEAERVHRAVATGQLIIDVLRQTGEDADHPAARVRIGIDTGKALAVNNGRRGHREPLFLGEPANHAAKRAGGGTAPGIFLTNKARSAIGLPSAALVDSSALTPQQIEASEKRAKLGVSAAEIVAEWREDLKNNPIGAFEFSGHTPPFSDLDLETLSTKNSRRQDAATVYADIDGFTAYVGRNINDDWSAKHVVRALHVLRGELNCVLHDDFGGCKVRFIGDCIHGLAADGTAQTTDAQVTLTNMTLCAGAMRSSFGVALDRLAASGTDARELGLAIGFEFGPMPVTRLGMKGDLIRCCVSRGVLSAEEKQCECNGEQTGIGPVAYEKATPAVRKLFAGDRKVSNLDFDSAVEAMAADGDETAKRVRRAALKTVAPAIHAVNRPELRPYCEGADSVGG